MTKGQRLKLLWQRIDIFVLFAMLVLLAMATGAAVMNWINQRERMQLVDRFPTVRAEERAACVREYDARLSSLSQIQKQIDTTNRAVDDTNKIVAYTLRFLGDRAKLTDARNRAVLEQARAAAVAASAAAEKTAQVEQKVTVAAVKADEAASTAKAVDKKLDTAVHPPLPARPWAGGH